MPEVTTRPTDVRSNLQSLRSAQKSSVGTAAYSRYVNRPAGRMVAAVAHSVGLSPDGATAISAVMSATGIALIALVEPSLVVALAVAVLLAGGYVMDSVDGQLARLRGRGSLRGEWLDHTVDCFKINTLHLAVAISWFRFPPAEDRLWLLVPLAFSAVQAVTYFGLILMPYLAPSSAARRGQPRATSEHPLRKWLLLPIDYGVLCLAFALLAWDTGFLVVYSALCLASAGLLALALGKWWRELSVLDGQGD